MKVRKNEDQWHSLIPILAGIKLRSREIAFESKKTRRIAMCKQIDEFLMEAEESVHKICQECQG